jgi:hypothetical protein
VHGYGGTRSTWSPLQRRLSDAGCTGLHAITRTPFAPCVGTIARTVVRQCQTVDHHVSADGRWLLLSVVPDGPAAAAGTEELLEDVRAEAARTDCCC